MGQFPLEPALSKLILSGIEQGCWEEVVTIAAMVCPFFGVYNNVDDN
jgi:HrpA-like RNA helicase